MLGLSFIGAERGRVTGQTAYGVNPATGERLEPPYHAPSAAEVDQAAELAAEAFVEYSQTTGAQRAAFLRNAADEIDALGDALTQRGMAETGLPEARIVGERQRTTGQLRLFASLVEEGSWVEARIEHAQPDRKPLPKPDLRSCQRPLGPVVVFCASNFPLAYSVAGGDAASAWAAGCPVIIKAHSSHPGTAELVAGAVRRAAAAQGLPAGIFSCLYGGGRDVGQRLVQHPAVAAVGFTGSRAGGRALMDLAAARPCPIPVYAEMSSINPVFFLPAALQANPTALAAALHASVTLGCGQFCTNPGLIIVPKGAATEALKAELAKLFAATPAAVMLNTGIHQAYVSGTEKLAKHPQVTTLGRATSEGPTRGAAAVFSTSAAAFLADHALCDEVFGPATLLVEAESQEEMLRLARGLEGQLTATLHAAEADAHTAAQLSQILEHKAGRLIWGGFPTGLEVCHATVHGGPYPATSDGRTTSVGTQAITRFTRLVAWQNYPQSALPAPVQDANPLGIRRLVDGLSVG